MKFESIAVLTSEESWFVPYAKEMVDILEQKGYKSNLFHNCDDIEEDFQVVFILSYFNIINEQSLKKHKHNLVAHESDLPLGKGWAPLFWQILEGKNKIPVVLFEATSEVDEGDIYIKDYITLQGHELNDEIRKKQAQKTIELCLRFLDNYKNLKPTKQTGQGTFYTKRTPEDSELDKEKSVSEQFNLLRIVNNEEFPAFFYYKGHKYILKIFKEEQEKQQDEDKNMRKDNK